MCCEDCDLICEAREGRQIRRRVDWVEPLPEGDELLSPATAGDEGEIIRAYD